MQLRFLTPVLNGKTRWYTKSHSAAQQQLARPTVSKTAGCANRSGYIILSAGEGESLNFQLHGRAPICSVDSRYVPRDDAQRRTRGINLRRWRIYSVMNLTLRWLPICRAARITGRFTGVVSQKRSHKMKAKNRRRQNVARGKPTVQEAMQRHCRWAMKRC